LGVNIGSAEKTRSIECAPKVSTELGESPLFETNR